MILTTFTDVSYASFPIDNSAVSANTDPIIDSWIPLVIVFW